MLKLLCKLVNLTRSYKRKQKGVFFLNTVYTWCGLSANLGCRSEMCCRRLAENTGRINDAKIIISAPPHIFVGLYLRNYGIYRQSEKIVKQQYIRLPHGRRNMVNFSPLAAEIGSGVWDTPANFNGFGVLAALLHGTLVVGVSQTLRRWTEGATYVRQGNDHVGHWLTF